MFRLYFVSSEAGSGSNSQQASLKERTFSLGSSIICVVCIILFFLLSWNLGNGNGAVLIRTCLDPNGTYNWDTDRWWAVLGIVTFLHCLGILISALLYIWLIREEKKRKLCTSEVSYSIEMSGVDYINISIKLMRRKYDPLVCFVIFVCKLAECANVPRPFRN